MSADENLNQTQFKRGKSWKSDSWSVKATYDVHHNGSFVGHVKSHENSTRKGQDWTAHSAGRTHLGTYDTRGEAARAVITHAAKAQAEFDARQAERKKGQP